MQSASFTKRAFRQHGSDASAARIPLRNARPQQQRCKYCTVRVSSGGAQPDETAATAAGPPEAAAAAAARQYDPGLESFKALIGEKRFTCTQCGKCCTGAGEVWVSDAEVANIARYLNMPMKRFLAMHMHAYSKVEGFRLLRSNLDTETRDCTFLRPDNTCAIHPVRPLQCSTYPWWPELMDAADWQWEKENICEGFDHPDAPPTDLEAAALQLKHATILEYQKRLAYKPSKKQNKKAAKAAAHAGSNFTTSTSSSSSSSSNHIGGSSSSDSSSLLSTPHQNQAGAAASWQQRLQKLQVMLHDAAADESLS